MRKALAQVERTPDVLDIRPAFTPDDARVSEARYAEASTEALLRAVLTTELTGRIALVSSFGSESAALLHMVAQIDRTVPVIFINTQKIFGETLAYRDELAERLGFTDLRVFRPDPYLLAARDATGLRWSYDPDGCCDLRKVEPLRRALAPFDGWISGRKAFQGKSRAALPRFEEDEGRLKVNPLADWTKAMLDDYVATHKLPVHPLVAQGYPSIGCAPCTSKVQPGEDPRAGRWRGWDKAECGIHTVDAAQNDPANDPVF